MECKLANELRKVINEVFDDKPCCPQNSNAETETRSTPKWPDLPQVKLLRIDDGDDCTLGVLLVDGKAQCLTLELPWRNNERNVSCIPTGRYKCEWQKRPSNGKMAYYIINVPGRSNILMHTGNTVLDSQGCPIYGSEFGTLNVQRDGGKTHRAVLQSVKAQDTFHTKMGGKTFELEVVNLYV